MTYTIYKSSDPDAPQLTTAAGSLKTILKACLITGYGTGADAKAPAGWLMPFEETNKAVFQPVDSGGENLMIRVDDSGSNTTLKSYSIMSDIDTGTEAFDFGFVRRGGFKWFLVACQRWFYLFGSPITQDVYGFLFYGNINNILPQSLRKTVGINCRNDGLAFKYPCCPLGLGGTSKYTIKRSATGDFSLSAFFNTDDYNNYPDTNDLIYADLFLSSATAILGRLPALKALPKNYKLSHWHSIFPQVFVVVVGTTPTNAKLPKKIILDLSDANQ